MPFVVAVFAFLSRERAVNISKAGECVMCNDDKYGCDKTNLALGHGRCGHPFYQGGSGG